MAPASPISTQRTLLLQSAFVSPSDCSRGGGSVAPTRSHFPARGCRCYNVFVAFMRCIFRRRRSQDSSRRIGGMVQGSARQVLNLKTRVRFPVPLPNFLV